MPPKDVILAAPAPKKFLGYSTYVTTSCYGSFAVAEAGVKVNEGFYAGALVEDVPGAELKLPASLNNAGFSSTSDWTSPVFYMCLFTFIIFLLAIAVCEAICC